MNSLLRLILETRRPTSKPGLCFAFITTLLEELKIDFTCDEFLNTTVTIGNKPKQMFTAHTDTVCKHEGLNELVVDACDVVVKGGGVLGADCGAGMYILIQMILAGKEGLYVFFSQEEQGRIGSSKYKLPYEGIEMCVSFDRKGTHDLIIEQMGEEGCSPEFAKYFELNFPLEYKSDPTGVYTDSYSFFDQIPECVNLSVGYYNQHSSREIQDYVFLDTLVDACIEFHWEDLPIKRDPTKHMRWDASYGWDNPANSGNYEESLADYCYHYPEVAAAMLKSYGVTKADLESFAFVEQIGEYDERYNHYDH